MAQAPPESIEVADGLSALALRTPTLPPATHTNAYLVGTQQCVLVEPASGHTDELARCIAWVERFLSDGAGRSLQAVVLTHHHVDHVGGAQAVAEHFGVPIWAHARTRERLTGRLEVDRELVDGEVLQLEAAVPMQLKTVFTPGHAPGHLCFFEPRSRSLIAGDMVAQVGTILVEPGDGDMALYLASLQKMAELAPSQLLPAHGAPLTDPQATLAFYVQHRLEREAKIAAALDHQASPVTARELLPLCYADTPRFVWPLAERSTEAHLLKLESEGRARREDGRWLSAAPVA